MRTPILAFAIAAALSAPALAAGPPIWTVQRPASSLGFTGSMSGQAFNGAFSRWGAQIAFDPHNLPASHVSATIDMTSVATGDPTRDESLPTPDWFSSKAFPKATFVSDKITAAGPGRYVAQGVLTLRDVSRPVSLPFTLAIAGDVAKMNGSVAIDRSAFGVGQGQWKGGDTVLLKVQINVAIQAKRAG